MSPVLPNNQTNGNQNNSQQTNSHENFPLIFLVEDDVVLADLTADYLRNFGYRVNIETQGNLAVTRILSEQPSLAILDVMLPGKDGIDICREVRQVSKLPILFLTARTEQIDQLLGLEIGADDYVCKPVEPRLLLARIKALLRRTDSEQKIGDKQLKEDSQHLFFDDINIDNRARRVVVKSMEIELSMPEYEVLWFLMSNAGTILSRNQIFNNIRRIDYDGSNRFVDLTISHIRTKLGDDAVRPKRIKTVRGKGYLFVPHCTP